MSLIEARKLADDHRATSRNGTNPLEAKRQKQRDEVCTARERQAADALAAAHGTTFKEAAEKYIAGQEAGWSSAAYRAQRRQSLEDNLEVSLAKPSKAAWFLERFLVRRSPVKVLVDQDVDQHRALA